MFILLFFSFNAMALDLDRLHKELEEIIIHRPIDSTPVKETNQPMAAFKEKRMEANNKKLADSEDQKNLEKVEDIEGEFFKDEIKTYLSAPEKPKKIDDIPGSEASDLSELTN
jgi:hypothetical protein